MGLQQIKIYRTPENREPFTDWLKSIRNQETRKRILVRLDRLRHSNFGDCKSVGDNVFELRLQFGSGYRIYFGRIAENIVLLLCGGDKSSQNKDIESAKSYWQEYKEANHETISGLS
jgi:putative addiction module killer protein